MFFAPSTRRIRKPQLQFSERRILLALGDLFAVCVAVLISLRIWTFVADDPFTLDFVLGQAGWFVFLCVLWLVLASANDFYDLRLAANSTQTLQRLIAVTLQQVVVYVLIFFLSPRDALPRLFILYYAVTSLVLIGAWRFTRPFLLGWASQPRRTLIVGAVRPASAMITAIREHAADEYDLRGVINGTDQVGQMVDGIPILGSGDDLLNYVLRDQIREIIITATHELDAPTFRAVMTAYELGIVIVPMTILYERITGRVPVEYVNEDWGIVFMPTRNVDGIFNPYPLVKRLADITFAAFGLLLFLLILPVLALVIRLDSPGGIFYTQERLGRNGGVFRIYKLRSMVPDAETQTGAVFAQKNDPRVTRVGRFLRKTRLDEVPQLFNVLRGDMSLIGPRPERPEHVARLTRTIPFYRTRLIVRPGLTGWAQVRFGYGSTDDDALIKLQYDLYYIRHISLLLDITILIRTVGKVMSMSGV
jgi:exopolysaccharide biosynthesis polyprenyl glycosylphosphotransferase